MGSEQEKHYQLSIDRVQKMRDAGVSPYPHKFDVNTDPREFQKMCDDLDPDSCIKKTTVQMAGRVMQKRDAGKLVFYTIVFNRIPIQALSRLDDSGLDKSDFKKMHQVIKRGDIIGIIGNPGKSKTGEITIYVIKIEILAPCLHMLPSEHFGLKDISTRYRDKALDGIMNPEVNRMLITRSITVQTIRDYLLKREFVEVTTPILWHQSGGANAKTFQTHYNAIKDDVYLRVAPELFLKQLIIGGMNKVFEIGKQFRNEEMDATHNPEFETLEFYETYADYNDLMSVAEQMLCDVAIRVRGSLEIQMDNGTIIIFTPPFKKIDIIPTLEQKIGEKLNLTDDDLEQQLNALLKKYDIECGVRTTAKMLDKLIEHFIEPECDQPTFLINHPKLMSPLAKSHRDNPILTERFELFIGQMEIVNAYTELNDPQEQLCSFEGQEKDRTRDAETMTTNTDFIKALEYGLPPTAGFGLGIDRLVMLLTGNSSIHEVIPFPIRRV